MLHTEHLEQLIDCYGLPYSLLKSPLGLIVNADFGEFPDTSIVSISLDKTFRLW
jgi:hypothetical protein